MGGDRKLSFGTSLREESKLQWGRLEESKLTSRDYDDELFYETASQKSMLEETEDDDVSEDDSFVKYINDVLGPIRPHELAFDPLAEYNADDDITRHR